MGQAAGSRMVRHGRWSAAAALLAFALVASGAPAAAGSPTTRVVDDDGHAKPGNCGASTVARASIQDAIDDSGPGDVVQVCPGAYRELITVASGREGLTVRAIGSGPVILKRPSGAGAGDPAIEVENDETHWVGHDIRMPTTGGCSMVGTVVLVTGATGVILEDIVISAVGSGDSFTDCGYEVGVRITNGGAAQVLRPRITDWRGDAVTFEDGSRGRVVGGTFRWIHPNTSPTTTGSVEPAGGPQYRTISAFGGSSVLIKGNDIAADPAALLLQSGIVAAGTNTHVRVIGNKLRRTDYGIVLAYEAHGAVRHNDVRIGSVNAILLYEDAAASITDNRATGYHNTIRLQAGGSTITDNDFRGSSGRDCLDGTTGGGTKGTANTWARNLGDATPTGICRLP